MQGKRIRELEQDIEAKNELVSIVKLYFCVTLCYYAVNLGKVMFMLYWIWSCPIYLLA